jgi:hypothetical protein
MFLQASNRKVNGETCLPLGRSEIQGKDKEAEISKNKTGINTGRNSLMYLVISDVGCLIENF